MIIRQYIIYFISANSKKVLYGLLKEPDINVPMDDEDEAEAPGGRVSN